MEINSAVFLRKILDLVEKSLLLSIIEEAY